MPSTNDAIDSWIRKAIRQIEEMAKRENAGMEGTGILVDITNRKINTQEAAYGFGN